MIAARAAFLVDLVEAFGQSFVAGGVFKFTLVIKNRLRKSFPDLVSHSLPGKLPRCFLEFIPKLFVGFLPTREADDGRRRRHFTVGREIVKRGNKFAVRQVTSRAEDDNAARLRHGAGRQTFA